MENLAQEGYFSLSELNEVCQSIEQANRKGEPPDDDDLKITYNFQNRSDSWQYATQVITNEECCDYCKVLMCKTLEAFIDNNWGSTPTEDRTPIFEFLLPLVFQGTKSGISEGVLKYINSCFIHILFHELPTNYSQIITELIDAASDPVSSKNCLSILSNFCQIIFAEIPSDHIPSQQNFRLQEYIGENSQSIYTYLSTFLSTVPSETDNVMNALVEQSLQLLHLIIRFVPPDVIQDTGIFDNIVHNFFTPTFLPSTLFVISDIFLDSDIEVILGDSIPDLFQAVINSLSDQIPTDPDGFQEALYSESSPIGNRDLDRSLCSFLSVFMDKWAFYIESEDLSEQINLGRDWMLCLTVFADESLLRTCADFWLNTMRRIFQSRSIAYQSLTYQIYEPIFPSLRRVLAKKMTHPREILLEYDEQSDELITLNSDDSVSDALYDLMIESFKFLTKIDSNDSMEAIQELFQEAIQNTNIKYYNSACYSMSALSGQIPRDQGLEFVTDILTLQIDLASQCESLSQKAQFISGLMYITSKFSKYLMKQPDFLKTIIDKLFGFMKMDVPSIPEMAINAFREMAVPIDIVKLFTAVDKETNTSYIVDVVSKIPEITESPYFQRIPDVFNTPSALNSQNLLTNLYEILSGILVRSSNSQDSKDGILVLLSPLNEKWNEITQNLDGSTEMCHHLLSILKSNIGIARAAKKSYETQMRTMFPSIIEIYKQFSEHLNELLSDNQQITDGLDNKQIIQEISLYRVVKGTLIDLVLTYFSGINNETAAKVGEQYFEGILYFYSEYQESPNIAKVPSIITLTGVLFRKLGNQYYLTDHVPRIYDLVFKTTAEMINDNFEEFIDFRKPFYTFLESMVKPYASLLLEAPPEDFRLLIDSITHGIAHYQHDICLSALKTIDTLISELKPNQEKWYSFLGEYFHEIVGVLFRCLNDTSHKFAFDQIVDLLMKLFAEIPNDDVTLQVHQELCEIFADVDPDIILDKLKRILGVSNNQTEFRKSIRDFIIISKHFKQYEPEFEKLEKADQNFKKFIDEELPEFLEDKDYLE